MKTEYDIGDEPILQARFFGRDGAPKAPTDAQAYIKTPDGVVTELAGFAATDDDATVWEATYAIVQTGKHWWRAVGTGDVKTAGERWFNVRDQQVVPA